MSEGREIIDLKTWLGVKRLVSWLFVFTWRKVRQSIIPYKHVWYGGDWWPVVKNMIKTASEDTFNHPTGYGRKE